MKIFILFIVPKDGASLLSILFQYKFLLFKYCSLLIIIFGGILDSAGLISPTLNEEGTISSLFFIA